MKCESRALEKEKITNYKATTFFYDRPATPERTEYKLRPRMQNEQHSAH